MKKGFTIIELLMALLIIGLLVAAVTIGIKTSQMKSRDARRVSDLQLLKKATSMYFLDHSAYPLHNNVANPTQGVSGYNCGSCLLATSIKTIAGTRIDNPTWGSVFLINQYLKTVPYDPENTKSETFVHADGTTYKSPAYYGYVAKTNNYKYITRLEQNANLVANDGGTVITGSNYDSINVYEIGEGTGWQSIAP